VLSYPSSCSFFKAAGTLPCHHFQSVASLPNFFPDLGMINVESYAVSQLLQHSKRNWVLQFRLTYKVECCYPLWRLAG
jgi:hypothetical protein